MSSRAIWSKRYEMCDVLVAVVRCVYITIISTYKTCTYTFIRRRLHIIRVQLTSLSAGDSFYLKQLLPDA